MTEATLLQEVIEIVRVGLARPQSLWQLAVIAVGLIAGALLSRIVGRRVRARGDDEARGHGLRVDVLRFSIEGIRRLAFPVGAFVTMLIGGIVLRAGGLVQRFADIQLLRLALTLLAAMAVIRLFVYVLRRSLPRATWLGSFERGIALVIWFGVALYLTGLLHDAMDTLESIRVPLGKSQITAWDLLIAAGSVFATVLAALWIGSSIEARLMRAQSMS